MDEPTVTPPSKQPKRFFDIAPPKNFSPASTSKPVIVSNRPEQADPMMVAAPDSGQPTAEPEVPERTALNTDEPEVALKAPENDSLPEEPEASVPISAPVETEKVSPEPAPDIPATEPPEAAQAANHEEPVTEPEPSVPAAAAPPKAATAAPPGVVVQHHNERGSAKTAIVVVVLLLIAVITLDILLDAGILHANFPIPHTHFFKTSG